MVRRHMAIPGIGIALILSGMAVLQPQANVAQSAHLRAVKTYTNTKMQYSMTYPSSWKVVKSANDDLLVGAKDGNAFIAASSVVGTATAAQIKARQAQALAGLGTPAGKLSYTVKPINGVMFQLSEQVIKTSKGRLVDTIVLDAVRRGDLFDFGGSVLLNQKNTDNEVNAVLASLFSIKIA